MMLFQQLEHLLKFVITNGNLSGYASELENIKAKKSETVSKQTMGQLVGQFLERINPDYEAYSDELEELKDFHFSFSFRIETDSANYAAKKAALADVVNQRNELIHHLLPKFDTTSQKSCEELSIQLDAQSEFVRREIKNVNATAEALIRVRKELEIYLSSDAGMGQLDLSYLLQTELAIFLIDIADQLGKESGWVSLSLAGQLVRKHVPYELERLRECYGHKTLKGFMLATNLFEFNEEKTSKGGVRVLFRLNSTADKHA